MSKVGRLLLSLLTATRFQRSDKSPSVPSGTRYATKDTHLPLRTAASVEDIMKLPVAFDIVTPSNSEFGPTSPASSRSFTAYDQMMKNGDQAKGTARTADSVAELQAFPSISSTKERDARLGLSFEGDLWPRPFGSFRQSILHFGPGTTGKAIIRENGAKAIFLNKKSG